VKKILVIFSLLSISLSAVISSAAPSTVDCLRYNGEDVSQGAQTLPFGNVLRIEKAAVQGKDRLTLFTDKNNYFFRYVFLGSFQMAPNGFTFKGQDTVSYDDVEISLNGNVLSIRIGTLKTTRSAQSLGESQNGKDCRQGLFPESMYF